MCIVWVICVVVVRKLCYGDMLSSAHFIYWYPMMISTLPVLLLIEHSKIWRDWISVMIWRYFIFSLLLTNFCSTKCFCWRMMRIEVIYFLTVAGVPGWCTPPSSWRDQQTCRPCGMVHWCFFPSARSVLLCVISFCMFWNDFVHSLLQWQIFTLFTCLEWKVFHVMNLMLEEMTLPGKNYCLWIGNSMMKSTLPVLLLIEHSQSWRIWTSVSIWEWNGIQMLKIPIHFQPLVGFSCEMKDEIDVPFMSYVNFSLILEKLY